MTHINTAPQQTLSLNLPYLAFQDSASPHNGHQHLSVRGCCFCCSGCRAENNFCSQSTLHASQNSLGHLHQLPSLVLKNEEPQPISSAAALSALKQVGAVNGSSKVPNLPCCLQSERVSTPGAFQISPYSTRTGLLPCPAGMF